MKNHFNAWERKILKLTRSNFLQTGCQFLRRRKKPTIAVVCFKEDRRTDKFVKAFYEFLDSSILSFYARYIQISAVISEVSCVLQRTNGG